MERYLADGTIDTSFAGTGRFLVSVPNAGEVHAVAVQPDGKILAAGTGPVEGFGLPLGELLADASATSV